MTRMPVV